MKENVIIGHLITCGTGLRRYRKNNVSTADIMNKVNVLDLKTPIKSEESETKNKKNIAQLTEK